MNRKNTILIAVLINAGLLAILLVTALTTQEEVIAPSSLLGDAPMSRLEDKPLFADAADLALREPPLLRENQEIALPHTELAKPIETAQQEPLVHKLPPLVPETTVAAASPSVTLPSAVPVAGVAQPAKADPSHIEVTVKKGDSLEKLAKVHHTTVDEILKMNHLQNTFLRIGQVLKVPTEKAVAARPAAPKAAPVSKMGETEYYTVKVGDNPWTISMKHHMKVEELLKINGLNEERARKLKPGDRLRIR